MRKDSVTGGNYIAIGIGLGIVFGVAFNKFIVLVAFGTAVGGLIEWLYYRKINVKNKD